MVVMISWKKNDWPKGKYLLSSWGELLSNYLLFWLWFCAKNVSREVMWMHCLLQYFQWQYTGCCQKLFLSLKFYTKWKFWLYLSFIIFQAFNDTAPLYCFKLCGFRCCNCCVLPEWGKGDFQVLIRNLAASFGLGLTSLLFKPFIFIL